MATTGPPPRVTRHVRSRERIMGNAPATPANRRYRHPNLEMVKEYVRSAGFRLRSPQAQDIFSIWKVTLTKPMPRTKRRSWNDLSPSYQKRLLGSKLMQEEAAQYKLSVPRWYELAPDLRSVRGHLPGGGFPTPRELKGDVWYEAYIAREYEHKKGYKLVDGKYAATSRSVDRAWKTTNTRRQTPPIRIGESLAAVLGMAGEAAGDAGEALEETGELWDDDW